MTAGQPGPDTLREPDPSDTKDHPLGVNPRRLWRSPLRGPWLTSVFGAALLIGLPIMIITGLLSYIAYSPQFGQALPPDVGWLKLPTFDWPSRPPWLYQLSQGAHVGVGLVMVPVVIAKLWSVIPRLFVWPPARSIAQVLERISLVMLVGGILFRHQRACLRGPTCRGSPPPPLLRPRDFGAWRALTPPHRLWPEIRPSPG
jgi:hypothetical protein